jgi:hypothetical protein
MMLSHANVSRSLACFQHSNFFKETTLKARPGQLRLGVGQCSPKGAPVDPAQGRTMSFFTATTKIYAIGARFTMATSTRLALQWFLVMGFRLYSFQLPDTNAPILLFIVTTSPHQDWVICTPAAFLGCGSHFSGSLSEIEP